MPYGNDKSRQFEKMYNGLILMVVVQYNLVQFQYILKLKFSPRHQDQLFLLGNVIRHPLALIRYCPFSKSRQYDLGAKA